MNSISIQHPRNRKRRRLELISEINITPLIDVLLVLLVVFMITTPMLVAGIKVDLPETKSGPLKSGQKEPLVITIDKAGKIYLLETEIVHSELASKLKAITNEKLEDARIFVRGDKDVSYGQVVQVMATIHTAGFTKVALISNIKKD